MASQLIGTTETGWFNPGVNPPPFDMKLLLMVAGSRSEDCGRTFEPYTVVMTAYVQQQGPGDEYDDETAFDEYMSGDQTDFLDFQFDLKDDEGEVLDWYSDSIVAWAYYPLGFAQTAVNVERERQAALVPIVSGRIEDAVAVYCTSCSAEISVCVPDVPDIQPEQVAEMWNTQSPVEDLSALVQRLVRRLRKAAPDDDLADKAMDYLRRTGRLGSPLRGAENEEGRGMSKELIERLRADAESTDDIGLCADAADRIEELERKVASRDAEVAKLKDDNEYLYVAAIERDQLRAHINLLRKQVEQLEAELETERMRLAACGVVALANTPESAAKARDMLPEYYSGSCEDVAQAVDREMALRDRAEQLEADRENLLQLLESASEVIGRFVSDEGWAQSDMDMMDTIDAKIASMRRAAQ